MVGHNTARIRELADYLDGQVWTEDLHGQIRKQAIEEGCRPDGFDGALHPLREGLDWLTDRTIELFQLAGERMEGTVAGLRAVADEYDATKESNLSRVHSLAEDVDGMGR